MTTKRHRKRIARELPPVGTTLQGRFKGETRTATIVEDHDLPAGRAVEYEGNRYTSLSTAAKAIGGHAVNGWRFWQPTGQDEQ
jgi:hypothetical protein